jgi:hypothetical protein
MECNHSFKLQLMIITRIIRILPILGVYILIVFEMQECPHENSVLKRFHGKCGCTAIDPSSRLRNRSHLLEVQRPSTGRKVGGRVRRPLTSKCNSPRGGAGRPNQGATSAMSSFMSTSKLYCTFK